MVSLTRGIKKKVNYEMMDVINLIIVIISQCIHISTHHIVHFKYIQFYLSVIPQ